MKTIGHNSVSAVCCTVLAAVVFLAAPGVCAQTLVSAEQPGAILEIAKGFGSAALEKDGSGDPMISGRIEGIKYSIGFYNCDDNGAHCKNILFQAGWSGVDVSLAEINDWNRRKRFGKAYLDGDNDPMLEMAVNLDFGVTTKNLEDTFDWWKVALTSFKSELLEQ